MADTALDKENPARKILIIGSVGAGKTTIARRLSQKVGIPHYELDCVARERQVGPAASARRNSK